MRYTARRWPVSPSARRGNVIAAPPQVLIHRDGELLAKAVAARLVTRLVDACAARGYASLVLTGGRIGTRVLAELAAAPARDTVDWRHLDILWGGQRVLTARDPPPNETPRPRPGQGGGAPPGAVGGGAGAGPRGGRARRAEAAVPARPRRRRARAAAARPPRLPLSPPGRVARLRPARPAGPPKPLATMITTTGNSFSPMR